MDESSQVFKPDQKNGIIFHAGLAILIGALGGFILLLAFNNSNEAYFLFWLMIGLLIVSVLPFVLYRGYALLRANYEIERDGIWLLWGLRSITIPLDQIEWIRHLDETAQRLTMPSLSWPGAVLGMREIEGLGRVEFLASDRNNLLLIATADVIYAISPQNSEAFRRAYRDYSEMGSLSPLKAHSVKPIAYLQSLFSNRAIRFLLILGLFMVLANFIMAAVTIPTRSTVSIGFDAGGVPLPAGSSTRLLLLPVLSGLVFIVDAIAGLYFYRRVESRLTAFLLWSMAPIVSVMLLLALIMQL